MTSAPAAARNGLIRSILFVPGHKPDWIPKAIAAQPDAIILDLEDAVADNAKAGARHAVAEVVATYSGPPHLFVRVNGWGTGHLVSDMHAAVSPAVVGVLLPKIERVRDVLALDHLLSELELANGLKPGAIEIMPLPESARAFHRYDTICASSARVRLAVGVRALSSHRGDLDRALGIGAPDVATDDPYIDLHLSTCARAAGVNEILTGPVPDVSNHELLRASLVRARRLGATGSFVVHPAQVAVVHEVFVPSRPDVERAVAVVLAMDARRTSGDAAVLLNGVMVDTAHKRSSHELLLRARALGLYPDLLDDVPSSNWLEAAPP
jgi:citrate lyase subunit beta/citryl-CoA lyase